MEGSQSYIADMPQEHSNLYNLAILERLASDQGGHKRVLEMNKANG